MPADKLHELAAGDELELIYLHVQSMRNYNALKDRLAPGSEAASPAAGKGGGAGRAAKHGAAATIRPHDGAAAARAASLTELPGPGFTPYPII